MIHTALSHIDIIDLYTGENVLCHSFLVFKDFDGNHTQGGNFATYSYESPGFFPNFLHFIKYFLTIQKMGSIELPFKKNNSHINIYIYTRCFRT